MKMKNILSLFLAVAVASGIVLTAAGCKSKTGTEGTTPYGNKTFNDTVKPSPHPSI